MSEQTGTDCGRSDAGHQDTHPLSDLSEDYFTASKNGGPIQETQDKTPCLICPYLAPASPHKELLLSENALSAF